MKTYEKERLAYDMQVDELLQTEAGQAAYWNTLQAHCRADSKSGLLESTLHLPGNVIECGVYRGTSLQQIGCIIAEHAPEKQIYACDSFEGFPEERVGRVDLGFMRFLSRVRKKFRMCQDTPARMEHFFETYGIQGRIVKGYFSDTLSQFENETFCFIHLDVDIYESYKECLNMLYPKLSPGGVVVFDDYGSSRWPGATKAVDEFFSTKVEKVSPCQEREKPSWYVRKPLA